MDNKPEYESKPGQVKPEQEKPRRESVISIEQIEKAKAVSKNTFNDALSLLFDPDNRVVPLSKTRDLAFAFIIAAIFVLVSTIFSQSLFPYIPIPQKGLSIFFGSIVLFFAGALSIFISLRYIAGKKAEYIEGLNIMSITFIPLIVTMIIGFLFSLASVQLALFIQFFGYTVSFLLLYSTIRLYYALTIRTSIYLLPIILTILMILMRIFFRIF